ncbi:hypothetical protein CEXT_757861 [Caerostris extrusa]|uniref:Uncharacterized protein n=1 Tax=Caerostris extrusa TaxID=172846 RepID=A0AAV4P3G8_CAEEX|nr:hypothetical protein CEXT_757861 [Caerostris extrusa]
MSINCLHTWETTFLHDRNCLLWIRLLLLFNVSRFSHQLKNVTLMPPIWRSKLSFDNPFRLSRASGLTPTPQTTFRMHVDALPPFSYLMVGPIKPLHCCVVVHSWKNE